MEFYKLNYNTIETFKTYVREHNYEIICGIALCCCKYDLYKNETYYMQHFMCFNPF